MTELLFLASKTQRKAAPCLRPVFYEKGSTEGPHVAYRFFPQKQRFYQLESKTYAFTAGKQVYVLAAAHLADNGMRMRGNWATSFKRAPHWSECLQETSHQTEAFYPSSPACKSSSTNMYTRTSKQSIYTLSPQISLALICQCP